MPATVVADGSDFFPQKSHQKARPTRFVNANPMGFLQTRCTQTVQKSNPWYWTQNVNGH